MLAKLGMKLNRWMMLLCVSVLASGCAGLFPPRIVHDYCEIAQKPFRWDSVDEVDATPIRPLRHIEEGAEIHRRLCP